jgi:hypothetical protein
MCQKNVGACAEESPYCFGLAKPAVAGFSQTSLMFSSLKMLSFLHAVTKCGAAAGRHAVIFPTVFLSFSIFLFLAASWTVVDEKIRSICAWNSDNVIETV